MPPIRIAILQPLIPHYRENFFKGIADKYPTAIYCYDNKSADKQNFKMGNIGCVNIKKVSFGPILCYNLFALLKKEYTHIILPLHFGHLMSWALLILKKIHGKKIITWGHGISVKRYLQEEKRPDRKLLWMMSLSDCVWFYTSKELDLNKTHLPSLPGIAIGNTISEVNRIIDLPLLNKPDLKKKYRIRQEVVLIYCARFVSSDRRTDLMLNVMDALDKERFGFIVIGDGASKPDFSLYSNVYDFGAVYDFNLKSELFQMADIYFQPGWIGLSVVEAMAYGKAIFTFKRSGDIKQCVEYNYVIESEGGFIFHSVAEMINHLNNIEMPAIAQLGKNAQNYVRDYLTMDKMVARALSYFDDES